MADQRLWFIDFTVGNDLYHRTVEAETPQQAQAKLRDELGEIVVVSITEGGSTPEMD